MTSLTTLRDVKPTEFEQAADGYHAVSTAAGASKDRINDQTMVQMRGELKGEARDAALSRLGRLSKNFHYAQVECSLISAALNGLASELRAAQKKLIAAMDDATGAGFKVKDDGSVHWETKPGEAKEDEDLKRKKAQGFADRIGDALSDAAKADQKWGPQLGRLKAQNDLNVSDKDWADVQGDMRALQKVAGDYLKKGDIPEGKSPAENAEWWKGLSDDERADYTALYPASVGALDGLPSDIRDEANRTVLAETRAKYQLELNAIPPEPAKYSPNPSGSYPAVIFNEGWKEWDKKYGDRKPELEKALKGMNAIQNRFDRTGQDGLPEAYLLGFDPTSNGDGRVILANGNPDTADHTAVYVPGTESKLETIGEGDDFGNLGCSEGLWAESNRLAPGKDISTITWFDYDAPDNIPEATRGANADDGGPTLRQFMDGNKTAHENATGSSAHTTVIGHSYGSTVVGVATQSGGMLDGAMANDIVVAGSPGMQVDRAADLGIRPDHMWAMGAPFSNDTIVRDGGRMMGLGDNWTIPTDESFGGNVMKSDSDDHGGFWNAKDGEASLSLKNQARVITGRYGDVVLVD